MSENKNRNPVITVTIIPAIVLTSIKCLAVNAKYNSDSATRAPILRMKGSCLFPTNISELKIEFIKRLYRYTDTIQYHKRMGQLVTAMIGRMYDILYGGG